jgi:hypothetical protein
MYGCGRIVTVAMTIHQWRDDAHPNNGIDQIGQPRQIEAHKGLEDEFIVAQKK